MKLGYRITAASMALCCSAALSLPAFAVNAATTTEEENTQAAYFGSSDISLRGLQIDSSFNKDYPQQGEMTAALLSGEADKIVAFAKQYQFNTLFYEISPRADAVYRSNYLPSSRYISGEEGGFILSDPLNVLLETADMEKINVVAGLSLFYAGELGDTYSADSPVTLHPDWFVTIGSGLYFDPTNLEVQNFWKNALSELVGNYNLDGIVLTELDSFTDTAAIIAVQDIISQCMNIIHQKNPSLSAGISLSYQTVEQEEWVHYLRNQSDSINFIIPEMAVSLDAEKDYSDYLEEWHDLTNSNGLRLYTSNQAQLLCQPLVNSICFGDERELSLQLYANAVEGADGYLICSYSDIKDLRSSIAADLTLVPDSTNSADWRLTDSSVPELSLSEEESIVYTPYTSYYLSGRCDPAQPLYINGEEVDKSLISKEGFWGLLLQLNRGGNSVSVRQGNKTERLTLYSTIHTERVVSEIDDIQPESVYPQENEVLYEGESLHLSCIAPYGGSVMAFFQNNTYHLIPPEGYTEADKGKAVEYSLEIYPEDFHSTQTTNLGKVSYILSYDDFNSKYRSEGQVYMVGSSSRLAVQVTDSVGRVYQNTDEDALVSNLPSGACDYASSLDNSEYYRLYSGGYIHKKDVSIIEGFVDIQKSVEAVGIQSHNQGENLIFVGGEGLPYYINFNEHSEILTFQLYNLATIPSSLAHLSSKLFDQITVSNNSTTGVCIIRLHLAEGQSLWAYQVSYSDGNLHLNCKTPPTLNSNSAAPLSGVTFVLDAGHGGVDYGERTIWGSNGPAEKDITLAYAQSLRRRLESLGAEVYLTRGDDSTMDEEDRILYSAYKDADFYLSFHGTTTSSHVNGQKEQGLSIYYDSEMSHELGNFLYKNLTEQLKLQGNRFSGQDLAIMKVPLARALIICPGVLTNPDDYERITNPVEIYRTSCVLSDLLIDYIRSH